MIKRLLTFYSFLLQHNVFRHIYLVALAGIVIGIFFSKAVLSISEITISCAFILEGNLKEKAKKLLSSKIALLILGIFFLHVLGLIFTTDFEYAFKDIRIKAPLFFFPIIFASSEPLSGLQLRRLNYLFILSAFVASLVILFHYEINRAFISDVRFASFIVSHVRMALLFCLSISLSVFYFISEKKRVRAILVLNILWMVWFMIQFEFMTGLVILFVITAFSAFWLWKHHLKKRKLIKQLSWVMISVFTVVIGLSVSTVYTYFESTFPKTSTDLLMSPNGTTYTHEYKSRQFRLAENGSQVYQNIAYPEIQNEWNKRSEFKVNYEDGIYVELENVLIRFLSSKGVPKDSAAVASLTDQEVEAIESGIPNVIIMNQIGLQKRIWAVLWELDSYFSGGNFNGHSLAMRVEYWKTCLKIFSKNIWTGTGTGDVAQAFSDQYDEDNSILQSEFRLRAHNQFLTIAATFGIFGVIYFLLAVFIPLKVGAKDFMFVSFSIIFIISMLTEDTLETQVGATFYAFFFNLYFFNRSSNEKSDQ